MDIILVLSYVAFAIAIFKIFRIPISAMTVTTAGLGGGFLMGWMYISMAYFHPYTETGRMYFKTSMISTNVKGRVSKVYVKDESPMKEGDPIYEIDPSLFLSAVKDLKAQLKLANIRLGQQQKLYKRNAGSLYELEKREQLVSSIKAQLIKANFNLENTIVRAPADGHIAQNRLIVGTMAGAFRLSSLGTFVMEDKPLYVAGFRPNGLPSIAVGAEAQVFFPAVPGKVFNAKVVKIFSEVAEGQLHSSFLMKELTKHDLNGRVPVQIELVDDISGYKIPQGSSFHTTVFSDNIPMLIELRRILFSMFSWENIINFEEGSSE